MRSLVTAGLALALFGGAGMAAAQEKDPAKAPAGVYKVDPRHTSVIAKVSHLGLSNFTLVFESVEGSYTYDPAKPEAAKVEVSVDPNSADTGVEQLNVELGAERFMNAKKWPEVKFVSTAIKRTPGTNRGTMSGSMTLMGVTKPVTFDVTYHGAGKQGPADKMGFTATAKIKRSDFNFTTMRGPLGDDVDLIIETEFQKS